MSLRKKVVKKKVTKHKVKKASKFSLRRLFAPFLVLALVLGAFAYFYLPDSSVLSSNIASGSSYGQALDTGGVETGKPNGISIAEVPLNLDKFTIQFFTKIDPNKTADINYIFRKPLHASNYDGGDLFGLYYTGFNQNELVFSAVGPGGLGVVKMPNVLKDGKWHHIAMTYEKGQGYKIYIDGKLTGNREDSSHYAGNYNNLPIYFGFNKKVNDPGSNNTQPNNTSAVYDEIVIASSMQPPVWPTPPHTAFVPDVSTIGLWHLDGNFENSSPQGVASPVGDVSFIESTIYFSGGPTPSTSVCKSVYLTSYNVSNNCNDGYRYVTYTCSDGYKGSMGGESSCKSMAIWKQYSAEECQRRSCSPTISIILPTKLPTKYPSPSPAKGKLPPCSQYGDANGDGYVSEADVSKVLRYVAALEKPNSTQFRNADVDGNGKLTSADALLIRRYVSGSTNTFVVCKKPTPTKTPAPTKTPTPAKLSSRPIPCGRYGDLNLDRRITSADLDLMKKFIVQLERPSSTQSRYADLNGSGSLTVADMAILNAYLQGRLSTFPICSLTPTATKR